jgi:hypothetical protein
MATSQVQEAQVPPSVNESQSNEPNRLEDPYSKFMPLTAEQRHFNHDTQVKHENDYAALLNDFPFFNCLPSFIFFRSTVSRHQ